MGGRMNGLLFSSETYTNSWCPNLITMTTILKHIYTFKDHTSGTK